MDIYSWGMTFWKVTPNFLVQLTISFQCTKVPNVLENTDQAHSWCIPGRCFPLKLIPFFLVFLFNYFVWNLIQSWNVVVLKKFRLQEMMNPIWTPKQEIILTRQDTIKKKLVEIVHLINGKVLYPAHVYCTHADKNW